jgi:hypothetical protein
VEESALPWDEHALGGGLAEPLEDQLAHLAAVIGPLRRVLAAIAERLIATRAYERLCYARLSDYARERPGLSPRQLQELARVHRALGELPALERALVANELPWSKVRLVARVATGADEAAWIARARAVSTRRLEEEVQSAQGPAPAPGSLDTGLPDDALPQRRVTLRCSPAVCEKWSLAREMAERAAGQRLSSGEALEQVVAEVFSGLSIDPALAGTRDELPPRPRREEARSTSRDDAAGEPRLPARELPRQVGALAAGLEDADPFELDRRLCLGLQLEQTLDAALAPLLRRVTCSEYEWRGAYQTLARFAEDRLGMSGRKARTLLRLERAGDVCPELRAAYRGGRLSWVKAQCLVPLFLLDIPGEWRPAWLAWAERVTVRRLEQDVERALLLRAGHHLAWQRCKFHPELAQDAIPEGERQMCAHDVDLEAIQELAWRVPCEVASLFVAVRETVRRTLGAAQGRPALDGEVFDAILDGALLAWTLRDPAARRPDPVMERDGWRCAVPGCTSRRNLHDHHVVYRSRGGGDAAANRVTLCAFHHQRCLHAGLLRIHGRSPDGLVFELGVRTGAPPLARYRSRDVRIAEDDADALRAA